ncbi:MAG: hypothetical protein FWG42_01585 [Clostridiales bacterium]|nr:hypothetical protein [Clostridiales bacterium]
MMQIYAKLHSIDYGKLLAQIEHAKKRLGNTSGLLQIGGALATTPLSLKIIAKRPSLIRSPVTNLLKEYGVSLSPLIIGNDTLISEEKGGSSMLSISASIESIDYGKLARAVSRPKKTNAASESDKLIKAVKILEPFIDSTMATVPASAIAELFVLLAKERVVELAEEYGVAIADVDVKHE